MAKTAPAAARGVKRAQGRGPGARARAATEAPARAAAASARVSPPLTRARAPARPLVLRGRTGKVSPPQNMHQCFGRGSETDAAGARGPPAAAGPPGPASSGSKSVGTMKKKTGTGVVNSGSKATAEAKKIADAKGAQAAKFPTKPPVPAKKPAATAKYKTTKPKSSKGSRTDKPPAASSSSSTRATKPKPVAPGSMKKAASSSGGAKPAPKRKKTDDGEPRVLKLTLNLKPFEVMVTGEKREEFREDTQFIRSRLVDSKTGERKRYDYVEFKNGYGNSPSMPQFMTKFEGYEVRSGAFAEGPYSNGLTVDCAGPLTFVLSLGEVVSVSACEEKYGVADRALRG